MKGKKIMLGIFIIAIGVIVMAIGVGVKEDKEQKASEEPVISDLLYREAEPEFENALSKDYEKHFSDATWITVEKVARTTVDEADGSSDTNYETYVVSDVDLKKGKADTRSYAKALVSDEMDDVAVEDISFEDAFGFSFQGMNGAEVLDKLLSVNGMDENLRKATFDKNTYNTTKQSLFELVDKCSVLGQMLDGVDYDELLESKVTYQTMKTKEGLVVPECITATVQYRKGEQTITKTLYLEVHVNDWGEKEDVDEVRNTLKYVVTMLCCIAFMASASVTVFADGIGDTGDTGQGNIGGSNVYTFYYYYNSASDAIELTVVTKNPIASFGNTNSHTYSSPYDGVVLNTSNPRLGRSLDDAISDMIRIGGYQMSVADAKSELNSLGYYDKGNGIWKYNGGYLTYISAVKIRKQTHTVSYDANGGSGAPSSQTKTEGVNLTLRSGRPHRTGYTFKYWNASIGGRYYPGGLYTHDQDGGTVVMKAYWRDETAPGGTIVAVPNDWSAGNGTVTITAQDQGSGLSSFILERYSYVTGTWITVRTWSLGGTTSQVSRSYTETAEGVFSYRVTISDKAGNVSQASSNKIYLDHSNPVIYGLDRVQTDWTNVAPVIGITTTDYLSGTNYDGSGVVSVVIQNDSGITVAGGGSTASYTLQPRDEGIHTWYVTIQDAVGHVSRGQVTTKYDITKPGMDGTEVTHVVNGVTYSGYCQDNIIKQHIDDEVRRSPNNPNVSSGVRSVILYRVTGNNREVIYGDLTKKVFDSSYTHSYFDMFYEIQREEKTASYYEVIVTDFAGNKSVKKLTSQYSLLSWFHTSIDRSTYE